MSVCVKRLIDCVISLGGISENFGDFTSNDYAPKKLVAVIRDRLRLNDAIDVNHSQGLWYRARVIELNLKQVKVEYLGDRKPVNWRWYKWGNREKEWVPYTWCYQL